MRALLPAQDFRSQELSSWSSRMYLDGAQVIREASRSDHDGLLPNFHYPSLWHGRCCSLFLEMPYHLPAGCFRSQAMSGWHLDKNEQRHDLGFSAPQYPHLATKAMIRVTAFSTPAGLKWWTQKEDNGESPFLEWRELHLLLPPDSPQSVETVSLVLQGNMILVHHWLPTPSAPSTGLVTV